MTGSDRKPKLWWIYWIYQYIWITNRAWCQIITSDTTMMILRSRVQHTHRSSRVRDCDRTARPRGGLSFFMVTFPLDWTSSDSCIEWWFICSFSRPLFLLFSFLLFFFCFLFLTFFFLLYILPPPFPLASSAVDYHLFSPGRIGNILYWLFFPFPGVRA